MKLPQSTTKSIYVNQIKIIEASLKDATSGEDSKVRLLQVQKHLDILAEKYQYDKELGVAIYKLYELQALVHYFNGNDEDALNFVNQAIKTKGENYSRAEKIKSQLLAKTHTPQVVDLKDMTKQERRKKLIGLEGWLAWYVVGLFIGTGITIFNFFNGGVGLSSSEINSLNQYQSGLGDTSRTLVTFENVAMIIYAALLVATIVFILRRKKLAKAIAIAGMVFGVVYTIADYTLASSLFNSANLTQYVQSELSSTAGYAGRSVVAAAIWIPYFLVSKRVKATLIE